MCYSQWYTTKVFIFRHLWSHYLIFCNQWPALCYLILCTFFIPVSSMPIRSHNLLSRNGKLLLLIFYFSLVTQLNSISKLFWCLQKVLFRSENLLDCFHPVGCRCGFLLCSFIQFVLHFLCCSSLTNIPLHFTVEKKAAHTHPLNGSFNSLFFSHRYSFQNQ